MGGATARIYDTSLRDGLRNSRIAIVQEDKARFVRLLRARADAFPDLQCAVDVAGFEATEALLADIARPTDDADSGVTELLRRWGGKAG